jgi:hypothetical protein
MIPEPRTAYDYTQSLSYGMAVFYRDTGEFKKAAAWVEEARAAYGRSVASDEYIDGHAATINIEAGNLDAAYELFQPQYEKYGRRAFEGHTKAFITFINTAPHDR